MAVHHGGKVGRAGKTLASNSLKLKGWLFENNQGIQQFLEIYQASG